jgi:hypothetical protein
MRSASRLSGAVIGFVFFVGTAFVVSGCDGPSQSTETKPIQTDILKKLGKASQAQSDAARSEHVKTKTTKK